jgi:hypothetical protein
MKAWASRSSTFGQNCGHLFAVVLCLLSFDAPGQDALSELDDAAARMQYAYFTEDSRALTDSLDTLAGLQGSTVPGLKEYFQAYGQWKLAQLYADAEAKGGGSTGGAGKAAQECQKNARAAIAEDRRMVEAYALQAICGSNPNGGNCSARPLRTALEMEPHNPRVNLIALLCLSDRERITLATLQRARSLVAGFEHAPPSRPGRPDWGHAEALTVLAQIYLERGDPVAARDSVERALVIAPDYRKAQQLLQEAARSR